MNLQRLARVEEAVAATRDALLVWGFQRGWGPEAIPVDESISPPVSEFEA